MQTQEQQTELSSTSDGAEVFTLQSHQIGRYWPVILKLLRQVEGPDWTTDEVFEAISDRDAQVWGVVRGGVILGIWITKIQNTKRNCFGLVWICAGSGLKLGLQLFPVIEDWFRSLGCAYVEIQGRKGWKKVMPDYIHRCDVLRKTL